MAVGEYLTWAVQAQSAPAHVARILQSILLAEGVVDVAGNAFKVAQDTGSNPNIKIGSGVLGDLAVIEGDDVAGQGTYVIEAQNATVTRATAASDPSNPRIDLVVLQNYDNEADSSGNNDADIEVIEGTPAGSPSAPAVPSSAIPLAEIAVGAGVTAITNANITDLRTAVRLRGGGPVQVVEATDQSSITSTTFTAGSPACGQAFVAPPSGEVWVGVYGFLTLTLSGTSAQRRLSMGWELREGAVIGSGTVTVAAEEITRAISIANSVDGNALQSAQADRYLVSGLVSGDSYNVQTMHKVNIAANHTANILERRITVEPVF